MGAVHEQQGEAISDRHDAEDEAAGNQDFLGVAEAVLAKLPQHDVLGEHGAETEELRVEAGHDRGEDPRIMFGLQWLPIPGLILFRLWKGIISGDFLLMITDKCNVVALIIGRVTQLP